MMNTFQIDKREVGEGQPCFIIAEAGINHNGDLHTAKEMIDCAIEAGVDAIKFQTFKAEEFVSDKQQTYSYLSNGKNITESMFEMFKRYEFGKEDFFNLSQYCKDKGIIFFSTPQNESDLEILLDIGIPAIKVGSDDLNNIPLMEAYAKKKLPMIISTGMSYLAEVIETVSAIKVCNQELGILHCVSSYPASYNELNLNRIKTLREQFPSEIIGFSDHSLGCQAAMVSIGCGAKIYEKHFTLDNNMQGPDHRFSADPQQLKEIVTSIRNVELSLGDYCIEPSENEHKMRALCRRSIVAARDLKPGMIIEESDIVMKRPGTGLNPKEKHQIIGKVLKRDILKDKLFSWEDFSND